MAKAASRASVITTLKVGQVEVPIGLFGTTADPKKTAPFDTAGPNGGALYFEQVATAAPVEDQEASPDVPVGKFDALGDPGSDAPPIEMEKPEADHAVVPGEFRRVLMEEGTGEVVEPDDVRRGIRQEDGSFIDCTRQIAAIEEQTKLDRMTVVAFMDIGQVQRERVTASYYVGAADEAAPRALRLLFEAMRATRRAAIVKWTKRSRQSLGVIVPHAKTQTLVLLQLAWAEDWREAPARAKAIGKAAVTEREVEAATELVRAMGDTRDALDELRDDAIVMREELFALAEAGDVGEFVTPPEPEVETIDSLMRDLDASLEATRAGAGKA